MAMGYFFFLRLSVFLMLLSLSSATAPGPTPTPAPPEDSPSYDESPPAPPPPSAPQISPPAPSPASPPPPISPPASSPASPPPPISPPASSPASPPSPISPQASPHASPPTPLVGVPQSSATPFVAMSAPPPQGSGKSRTTLLVLAIVGPILFIVLVCVGIFVFCYKRRKLRRRPPCADDFAYAPQPQQPGNKDATSPGPMHNLQQSSPRYDPRSPGKFFGLIKRTSPPSTRISSNSRSSSSSKSTKPIPDATTDNISALTKTTFTFEELALTTGNFCSENFLGQGGFGYVHKGVFPDGREVAIKQLKVESSQGDREFQAEVITISRVHHKHLVSLVGYCISGTKRLLVYEFVHNGSLDSHLHGMGKPPLNWATRMKIAMGSAKGLSYLHDDCHPRIIHRDIKSANILLDENFVAKVADFGLAKFFSEDDTHVSTGIKGTKGYLAPEYALSGYLTDKSDVFSFGVVLLELITGRQPIDKAQKYLDDNNIVDWARPLLTQALESGNFDSVADPRLQKDYDALEMARMVACASVCVRHLARRRPRMSQIFRALEGNLPLDELIEGVQSGYGTLNDSHESSDYDTKQYREDLKKYRKMALESSEVSISESSGPTNEFGRPVSSSSSGGGGGLSNTQKPSV